MKEMNSKSPLLLIILLIILCGIGYWVFISNKSAEPVQVLSPDNYEQGTTISLYEKLPPSFPKELILGNLDFKKASVLNLPSGKTQTSLVYISKENSTRISEIYKFELIKQGWAVVSDVPNERLSTVTANKDGQLLIVTAVKEGDSTLITFQYEK